MPAESDLSNALNLDELGVDKSWHTLFKEHWTQIMGILGQVDGELSTPPIHLIFRAFGIPVSEIRVVIFGQDPYPGDGVADGLAFSSPKSKPIPASLRNIFKEYVADLNLSYPDSPDLQRWSQDGVMLLNRSLTTEVGERNAHIKSGWQNFTFEVARYLAGHDVVAILWGNYARELAPLFTHRIESAHPSPLSARKGFFGSRPFSTANELLVSLGRTPIDWRL